MSELLPPDLPVTWEASGLGVVHCRGWTLLPLSRRGPSQPAFIAKGTLTAAEMIEGSQRAFPDVWKDIRSLQRTTANKH